MIDERDLLDPALNYSASENQPYGLRIPEHIFRQLISWSLQQIRTTIDEPINLVDELFKFHGDVVRKQIKNWLREHPNIFVGVNWPPQEVTLPFISVINSGEPEDPSGQFLGSSAGSLEYTNNGRTVVREHRAVLLKPTSTIYICSTDPNLTAYLYAIVRFIFFSNTDQLSEHYDIHNLIVNGQDLHHDPSLFPTFGYFKVLQLQYQTMFDYNVAEEASKLVSLGLMVNAIDKGNVLVDVSVPSEDD